MRRTQQKVVGGISVELVVRGFGSVSCLSASLLTKSNPLNLEKPAFSKVPGTMRLVLIYLSCRHQRVKEAEHIMINIVILIRNFILKKICI